MRLTEIVKKSFLKNDEPIERSSEVQTDNVLKDLSDEPLHVGSFFDSSSSDNNLFTQIQNSQIIFKQKDKILKYRELAMQTNVIDAIDEIVNEIIFSYDDELPIKIDINEENETLVKAISDKFDKILQMINIRRNIFEIVKRGYVDGRMIIHCGYDKKTIKSGIQSIKMIEPCLFYYDEKEKVYKYMKNNSLNEVFSFENNEKYSPEEIVIEDFGLYKDKLNLSYLEYAIKPANMLNTLEDLLIPLRFSRSISRRVFNVDVGDLPTKRAQEVMKEYQTKFKYKKFYNNDTGEVSNQQHITSMVEDYWFSNRSGGKGTEVELLDETGNLGELNDIIYISKKLYNSMKIPSNRISIDPDADKTYEFDTTQVSKEDMKFFMFISRLRQVYSSLFKEILKREVVSTEIMSEQEWKEKENEIKISFVNENNFIQKMKLENFLHKLEIYATAQEYQGKLFSVETILKDIFRFSEEEIEDEFKKIQEESKNPLYKKFYTSEDGESQW